ncbi:MAG: NOB1 family endonuclease [Bacilli bacterium]|nr:NOB1 family endonuclease [Bacilli bacterium]
MMKDKFKRLLFITMLMIPMIVFADTFEGVFGEVFPIGYAIGMEAFVSIHMSVFVLWPISNMLAPNNNKQLFAILFVIRAAILLYFDFFVTTAIAMVDFFAVFAGAFIIVPIMSLVTKRSPFGAPGQILDDSIKEFQKNGGISKALSEYNDTTTTTNNNSTVELRCARCYSLINMSDKFCPKCGYELKSSNIMIIDEDKKGQ